MWDALGFVGILVFYAGIYLIWQARAEVLYWVEEYLRLWGAVARRMSEAPSAPSAPPVVAEPVNRSRNAVRLVIGSLLAFVLGPLLFSLGLAL